MEDARQAMPAAAEAAPERASVRRLLKDAQTQLLDTGARNRLIHVNRKAVRANVVNIVGERSDDVFRMLVGDRKSMSFAAMGKDVSDDAEASDSPGLAIIESDAPADPMADATRYSDRKLETRLGPDGLQKRLLKLARDAATSEQEQGINILFLAMGFLRWFEDDASDVVREAPLLLVPVSLKRNARTSTYDLVVREDDIVTNLSLKERLKADFGLVLPDVPEGDLIPSLYFDRVRDVADAKPRWSIDDNAMQLGFFSFAKLLMLKDLAPENWPEEALLEHGLVNGLLAGGFEHREPAIPNMPLDVVFTPADLVQVVDADGSQTRVIEEVRAGRNLVVQGPPGTGKSQTITNIIAAAVHDGKRVLFVAEKMAALSVVHSRLVNAGLRDVCLELHSRNANKKTVLEEIRRSLGAAQATPELPGPPDALHKVRDELNALSSLLHEPLGQTGETPFRALGLMSRLLAQGAAPPSATIPDIDTFGVEQLERIVSAAQRLGRLQETHGAAQAHPFYGVGRLDLQPMDLDRMRTALDQLAQAAAALAESFAKLAAYLKMATPVTIAGGEAIAAAVTLAAKPPNGPATTLLSLLQMRRRDDVRAALEIGEGWRKTRADVTGLFVDSAWGENPHALRAALAPGKTSFFARLGGKYRNASMQLAGVLAGDLPKTAGERLKLVDDLARVKAARQSLAMEEDRLGKALGEAWRSERTDFAGMLAMLDWCDQVAAAGGGVDAVQLVRLTTSAEQADKAQTVAARLAPVRRRFEEIAKVLMLDVAGFDGATDVGGVKLEAMARRLGAMAQATSRYGEWVELRRADDGLRLAGAIDVADALGAGRLSTQAAETEIRLCRAEAIWKRAIGERPKLATLAADARRDLVETFQRLEHDRLKDTARLIRAKHLAQTPQGGIGEMGVIRGELGKQRGHLPIRKLLEQAGETLQRIKPVMLMSPLSVAQFLRPGKMAFDLLVIDEASQVRPEDSLGAIARAKQIVVVGDRKQLPPTSFFDRLTADVVDEEELEETPELAGAPKATELESILSLCEARGVQGEMLKWHYRSRDPSLIAVSNDEFYESRLVLPPSPLQGDPAYGLMFRKVDGAYDRGKKRNNQIEADAIVKAVADHARVSPKLSLGVVTFSMAQRDLIGELLELARRSDAVLDDFLREGGQEDFFLKNLENVQGDERDVIFVSVGYGPTSPGGRLDSMSFGPVNGEGGERRLNVLFTRAKLRCEVFASFHPGDIVVERAKGAGVRVLKRFLDYAMSGVLDEKRPTGAGADSPFEDDVADAIRAMGYAADHQVGSGGFRIDLGVRHDDRPGKYILAVECDGASYHGALWARERDRLRQEILEHLGWRFHRIWSTDWFYRRAGELERLKAALDSARDAELFEKEEQRLEAELDAALVQQGDPMPAFDAPPLFRAPQYRRTALQFGATHEPHEVPAQRMSGIVREIVETEGPVHQDEIARRVAEAFGKDRAGRRIVEVTVDALGSVQASGLAIAQEDGFWFTPAQRAAPPVRDRSGETGALVRADMLPPIEIAAAIRAVLGDNGAVGGGELAAAAAKVFGFKRTGPELREAILRVANDLAARGELTARDGGFRLVS